MLGGMRVQVNEPPWSLWYVERVVGETSPLRSMTSGQNVKSPDCLTHLQTSPVSQLSFGWKYFAVQAQIDLAG